MSQISKKVPKRMIHFYTVLVVLGVMGTQPLRAASPATAGFLSIVPGLGQVVQGRPFTGIAYLGGFASLLVLSNRTMGRTKSIVGATIPSFYCYQIYAAYRDSEPRNHMYGDTNIFQDYTAAFNPWNLLDLKVIAFDGVAAYTGAVNGKATYRMPNLIYYGLAVHQEEALYRGFLYPVFTDWFGGFKIGAAVVTSVLDSAQHALYLSDALSPPIFAMRTVLFLYLTWMYDKNNYHMPRNIFAHAWFDYLLRSSDIGAQPMTFQKSQVDGFVGGVKFNF